MLTNLQTRLKHAGRLLPFALLPFAAHAQLGYPAASAVNAAGTYTDLAATGTAISTANTDDANSTAQPIGFTFAYNGASFTQFVLNTNGFIKLGATAPSAADLFLPESMTATQIDPFESTNAADVNIVAPFNFDLTAGTAAGGTEYRVATTGTAPNRVCTIQWKNVADKTLTYDQQYGSMNFQVKLYETTANIEFVYGTTLQGTLPDDYRFAVTGIKGSSTAQSVMVVKSGPGTTPWSGANFINGFYTTAAFQYSGNVRPDLGRTYRFVPGTAPTTCGNPTAATIGNATNTSVQIAFTPGAGNVSYNVTYTAAGGTTQTVTPAPTSSPITITGLTAGTTYTVTLQSVCAGGATGAVLTGTATTTGGTTPTPLANDEPTGAIALALGVTCTPTNGTNVGATTSGATNTTGGTSLGYTNPGCGIAVNPKDVWYKFTTAASGVGSTFVNITVTGNPAGQVRVFSAASAAGPFTSVGCAAGTTNNTVAAPLRVGGLTPNTTYYVFVSGYGSGDTTGAFTICATGLATPAAPAFVTLPYTEGFEGTWTDVLATRDVPTNNWRNSPASGDRSWRRDDDGVSANWRFLPTGAYTPVSSTGARSARFHTYGASPAGVLGVFDLYVNMSGVGNKALNFDYINPTGADSLKIFVSTDGGATFGATPVRQVGVSAAFAAVPTITIASTSATTVIRFQAKSDYGNDDLGIDNLRLTVVTATTNAAMAATVSLYPNPAHQSFQLSVPTGLRAASATLSNTLGQVVLARQLNLPAAGGTTDFNVSSLAPGVYTLTLKSGADLVVKRVVVE